MFRIDPGPCPICDTPHCACTPVGALDSVVILGQRDAMVAAQAVSIDTAPQTVEPPVELVQPFAVAEPEPAPFTTSSYKRAVHGPKRPKA